MKAKIAKLGGMDLMLPIVLAGLMGSCATASAPSTLVQARQSLIASRNGLAAALAPSYLDDAKEMLERANREFALHGDSDVCRDYSYIAENKFELADAVARAELYQKTVGAGNGPERSLQSADARGSTGGPPAR